MIKSRSGSDGKVQFYKDLIQVSNSNESVIFSLDHATLIEEVDSQFYTGHFEDPDTYINTGFIHLASSANQGKSVPIIKTNESKTLLTKSNGILYSTHSDLDLAQLMLLDKNLTEKVKLTEIEQDTLLSTFEGQTCFSIFMESIEFFEFIAQHM